MSRFSMTVCVWAVFAVLSATSAAPTTPHDDQCFDVKDCSGFDQKTTCCGQYEAFSKANCRRFCNFCFPTVTVKPNCVDTIPNCNDYNADLCTNKLYEGFVKSKCAGRCKLCSKPVYHPPCAGNGTLPGLQTTPPAVVQTTPATTTIPENACFSEGAYYATGERWYTDNCDKHCVCVDGAKRKTHCELTKCPTWVHNCDLVYKDGSCCPTLKCNYFNTIHGPRTAGRK